MKHKQIFLVRHAESEINSHSELADKNELRVYGRSEWSLLTEEGKIKSRKLGKYLKQNYIDKGFDFDRFVASPAIRAQSTARYALEMMYIGRWPKYEIRSEVNELDQGKWEGQLDYIARPPHVKEQLAKEGWFHQPPGGESQHDVYLRAKNFVFLEIIKKDYCRVLVFTHGHFIKCFLAGTLGWKKDTAYKVEINSPSVTVLECFKEDKKFQWILKPENFNIKIY